MWEVASSTLLPAVPCLGPLHGLLGSEVLHPGFACCGPLCRGRVGEPLGPRQVSMLRVAETPARECLSQPPYPNLGCTCCRLRLRPELRLFCPSGRPSGTPCPPHPRLQPGVASWLLLQARKLWRKCFTSWTSLGLPCSPQAIPASEAAPARAWSWVAGRDCSPKGTSFHRRGLGTQGLCFVDASLTAL